MFSGRRSARAGAPVGAPFAASVSGRTGVEVFSGKTGKPQLVISGHVADFARGKSEPGLAARSRTVAGGCSGGRAARALVDSAADTAATTDKSCSGSGVAPVLWLIPQPTRLPLQKTRAADQRQQLQTSSTTVSAQRVPDGRSTTCRSAASFCPDSRRRLSPPSCQARFCQKSSSALRFPRKILRSALRMLAILVG